MRRAQEIRADLCVIGGGSGGFGAALAAARSGLQVVVVEKGDRLGGNAVRGGVHAWEMGVGGTAFPYEIFRRLQEIPQAVGVSSFGRHICWRDENVPPFPGGESLIDNQRTYEDTLKRHGTRGLSADRELVQEQWHNIVFEPEAMAATLEALLNETGQCRLLKNTTFVRAQSQAGKVISIEASDSDFDYSIHADYFVDATADVFVCRQLGCKTMQGAESKECFDERHAPDVISENSINAATLIYRVTPTSSHCVEPLPDGVSAECSFRSKWPVASINQYPNGDLNINMLPTMEADELIHFWGKGADGYQQAYDICKERVYGHWHWIQSYYPEFRHFRLSWIAPALGVRETRRVVGEYILTENDLDQGLSGQPHDDIIAIADHARDLHGRGTPGCAELEQPYGIPLRCLIPKGWRNLMVACRGASFSHIAASSCRLSRTMMDLGHAAGLAVADAVEKDGCDISQVNVKGIRQRLIDHGATLGYETASLDV